MEARQPFDWSEYLKLADELARRSEESSRRTSMSRAYYYVYHLALTRAEANGFRAQYGGGSHTQMWQIYAKSPHYGANKLAQIAQRLKERRERADYKDYYPRLEEDLPGMLEDAQDFARRLSDLPSRLPTPL